MSSVLTLALVVLAGLGAPGTGLAGAKPAAAASAPAVRERPSAPSADSAAVVRLLRGVLNASCPLPGVATGGQPREAHLKSLAAAGYRTVLDLRTAEEPRGLDEPRAARAAGLELVSLPVTAATLGDPTYETFRRVMRSAGPGGVFVHCASGNRVGAVMVPWLVLDRGWDLERAVAEAKLGGMRNERYEAMARDYVRRQRERR